MSARDTQCEPGETVLEFSVYLFSIHYEAKQPFFSMPRRELHKSLEEISMWQIANIRAQNSLLNNTQFNDCQAAALFINMFLFSRGCRRCFVWPVVWRKFKNENINIF